MSEESYLTGQSRFLKNKEKNELCISAIDGYCDCIFSDCDKVFFSPTQTREPTLS